MILCSWCAVSTVEATPHHVTSVCRESLRRELQTLEGNVPTRPPVDRLERRQWAQVRLHLRKGRYILENYTPGTWSETLIARELQSAGQALTEYQFTETLSRISRGNPLFPKAPLQGPLRNPPSGVPAFGIRTVPDVLAVRSATPPNTGIFEAAYWCELDASPQPFVGFIPESYDGTSDYPLLVYLHGYSPYLDIINWSELSPDMLRLAEEGDFLVVAPFGRGNTDFQGIGEKDVLRVISEMQTQYRVAADRIFLLGYSMGGMGAWTIAAHYPQRFAGILIVSGRACYYTWHHVSRADLPYYKQAYIDMEFAHSLLPNLKNLPILCYHGSDDMLVPVAEARTMARALQPLNPDFQYVEINGGDHWMFDDVMRKPKVRSWLETQRLRRPETFTYISWHPRYHRAHWLSLPADAPAGLRRKVTVTQQENRWIVDSENATTIRLHPDLLPPAISSSAVEPAADVTLEIANDNACDNITVPRGPLKEFFLAPFMFVQAGENAGTASADARFAARCHEWEQYSQAPPRQAQEWEMSADMRRDYNLFLFGEPEHSPMIRRIIAESPLTVTPDEYIVADVRVPRAGNGLLMVYRSPWHPRRLVAVQCGHPWGEHLARNHRYDYLPDYIVYAADPDPDGSNRAWIAGFFDSQWQLQSNTIHQSDNIPKHPDHKDRQP